LLLFLLLLLKRTFRNIHDCFLQYIFFT
jgi:hypothetical protein